MKKHLLAISFILISLLAMGAVSAADGYNMTDDSVMTIAGVDDNAQSVADELDGFKDESVVGEQGISGQSEGSDNATATVTVNDVTVNQGEIAYIPFNVTDSNGNPVCGGVNVTVYGENETISRYIELNNVTGQKEFTLTDFIQIINANGLNVSDIYDIIRSSSNFTNVNVSQIIMGLNEIEAGYSMNTSNVIEGIERVINETRIDYEKLIEGLKEIINGTDINISEFIAGFDELRSGIEINDSSISKITDALIAVIGGFHIDGNRLLNNVLDSIIINKASFVNGINDLVKQFNGGSSSSLSDLMSRMNLNLSLKNELHLGILMLKKEFTLLEVVNIANEILDYNRLTKMDFLKRLSETTGGFTIDVSDVIDKLTGSGSDVAGPFNKIIQSVRIDSNKIINSLVRTIKEATFDNAKVANELVNITGMDASKISKILDGVADIYNGFEFDTSNLISGMNDIFTGFRLDNVNLTDIFGAISFDEEMFTEDFDMILANFNLTRDDVLGEIHVLIDSLNMTVSDELDLALSNSFSGDMLNFTNVGKVFKDILTYNNVASLKALSNGNGVDFNFTKIFYTIANSFNPSKVVNSILKIIPYVNVDYNRLITSIGGVDVSFNKSLVVGGMARIFNQSNINVSKIITGIDKITREIDLNDSMIRDFIHNNVKIDPSKLSDGFAKVVKAFSFEKSAVDDGLVKIISAFSFNRAGIYAGFDEIVSAFTFNSSLITKGIHMIAGGLGVNVSDVIMNFFAKYGYIVTFQNCLAPGTHDVTVEYSNGTFSAKEMAKLTVLPKRNTPISFDVSVDGYHVYITGKVNPDARGLVLFEIGDYDVYNLIVDGKILYDTVLESGKYNVRAIYLGDLNFNENSTVIPFTVKSITTLISSDVNVVYANTKNIIVTLKDDKGNCVEGEKITVKLNGKPYTGTTNSNGQISVAVPNNLKPGTYAASIAFDGDSNYVKSASSVKVAVSKATPKITASAKTFKRTVKTKQYTITLKDNKNKVMKNTKVTIKVNKKTYTAKTNSKGQATFKITKLTKKGTFKATVTYAGNAYYNKVTKNVNIKVK